jgi:5-methylcytosine-specific restriction protein A
MAVCLERGCPVLVKSGRCAAHERHREERRGTAAERGYGSRWQRRARLFKTRYPLCGMRPGDRPAVMSRCYEAGLVTAAYQVDHVEPHRGDEELFWDEENNWQSLCRSCGAAKSRAGL